MNFWKRSMSITPTAGIAAPNRSGRWFSTAPTSRPPLLPPKIASFGVEVYLLAISHSAAAMKSSKTFCFFARLPASCHSSPYSAPPRRLATAYMPPISIHAIMLGLNEGSTLTLKPP